MSDEYRIWVEIEHLVDGEPVDDGLSILLEGADIARFAKLDDAVAFGNALQQIAKPRAPLDTLSEALAFGEVVARLNDHRE